MHVLIIPSWYPAQAGDIGGSFFREQALAVHKQGCKVGVIYPQLRSLRDTKSIFTGARGLDITNDEGLHTYRQHGVQWLPKLRRLQARQFVSMGMRLFKAYIKDHGLPDIVHVHSLLYAGGVAAEIKRRYGIPFVVTEHSSAFARGLVSTQQKRSATRWAEAAEIRWAVSGAFAILMARIMSAEKDMAWKEMPNIVHESFLTCDSSAKLPSSNFIFTHISFLNKNKNVDALINAFELVHKKHSCARLVIGGDGPERAALEALSKILDLGESISFKGMLSRTQVRNEMIAMNAFVLPSRYETFGVVLVEAMALGKPVVATRCGGPESIVVPEAGLLVPINDVAAMAAAMCEIMEKQESYDPAQMREYCREKFSEAVIGRKLIESYRIALSQ